MGFFYFRKERSTIKLFDSPPLGIFPDDFKPSDSAKESVLTTWDLAWERDKVMSVTKHPRNYFEEMIRWTEQGKLWPFPIDNEMGKKSSLGRKKEVIFWGVGEIYESF